jgi:hypothetical protein
VFDKFSTYHMKILLEDFNANVGSRRVSCVSCHNSTARPRFADGGAASSYGG